VVHVNNKAQYLVFPCLSSLDVSKTLHLLVESSKRPGQTRVNAALFATKKAPNKPRYFPSTRSGTFLKTILNTSWARSMDLSTPSAWEPL
jgi:hypothetical protein